MATPTWDWLRRSKLRGAPRVSCSERMEEIGGIVDIYHPNGSRRRVLFDDIRLS